MLKNLANLAKIIQDSISKDTEYKVSLLKYIFSRKGLSPCGGGVMHPAPAPPFLPMVAVELPGAVQLPPGTSKNPERENIIQGVFYETRT